MTDANFTEMAGDQGIEQVGTLPLKEVPRRGARRRLRGPQTRVVVHVGYFSNDLGSTIRWADTSPIIWISTVRAVKYQPPSSRPNVS